MGFGVPRCSSPTMTSDRRGPLLPSNRASSPNGRSQRRPPPQRGHSDRSLLHATTKTRFANCRSPSVPEMMGQHVDRSDYAANRGPEAGPRPSEHLGDRCSRSADEPRATSTSRPLSPFGLDAAIPPSVLSEWGGPSTVDSGGRDSPLTLKWRPPPLMIAASSAKDPLKDTIVRLPDPPREPEALLSKDLGGRQPQVPRRSEGPMVARFDLLAGGASRTWTPTSRQMLTGPLTSPHTPEQSSNRAAPA